MDGASVRRSLLISSLAVVLGLLGGFAAYALIHLIGLITNLAFFHRFGWDLPSFRHLGRSPDIVVIATLGGFVVALMAKWAPLIKGHGIPEAMEAVLDNESRISPRTAIAKPISAALAIGTGGPFGAEGPIIVTGGALGSLIGQVIPVSPSERKILLACGASAGMAATFGSPLAAVILAIELLLFEFSARTFVPLVVASAVAAGVHEWLLGQGALFPVPPQHYSGLGKLPLYAVLGLVCGLAAILVNRGLFVIEGGYRRLPVDPFWHPVIGGVLFGIVGVIFPPCLGVGYDAIGDVLTGRLAVGTLAALGATKLAAWWLALASGTSGGTVAPLLLISGCFGSLLGTGFSHLFPGLGISPGGFALVAMAATFGASVRATFTSIVFVFELTRDYHVILPLMVASVVAELVALALARDSLMTEKLHRRGLRVQSDYQADVLSRTLVAQVMTRDVATLEPGASAGEARGLARATGHATLPVARPDGTVVGIVDRGELWSEDHGDATPVTAMLRREVAVVDPGATVLEAAKELLAGRTDEVLVLDDGHLIGILTRTDVLVARARALGEEEVQEPVLLAHRRLRRLARQHRLTTEAPK